MSEQKYCLVQFKYTCNLSDDEEPRVVGSTSELGNWNVYKAEKMIYGKSDVPIWKTKENIKIFQNTFLEYKYIIFKNGKFNRWEDLPNNTNRSVNISDNNRITLWDREGDPHCKLEKNDFMVSSFDPYENGKQFIMNEFYEHNTSQNEDFNYDDNKQSFGRCFSSNSGNFPNEMLFDEGNENDEFNDLNYESAGETEDNFQKKKKRTKCFRFK